MATAKKDAFSSESNISPANMPGNTVLVAIPGYRNVVHITTEINDGEVKPLHFAVRSAFMPYDKEYRADYRAKMAGVLMHLGGHSEATGRLQNEVPAKLENEAPKKVPIKVITGGPNRNITDLDKERSFFKSIDSCLDTKFNGYGEYECSTQMSRSSSENTSFYSSDNDTVSLCGKPLHDTAISYEKSMPDMANFYDKSMPGALSLNDKYMNDTVSYKSGMSAWESYESILFGVDPNKKNDGRATLYNRDPENVSVSSFSPSDFLGKDQVGIDDLEIGFVSDGHDSASYFSDGVLESDSLDIDYDYFFVDEWGCVTGRKDESGFWKFN